MSAASTETGPWLRRFHPAPDTPVRLVCFPHAGGSASYYFPVSKALSAAAGVLVLQYPGRQDRRLTPCVESIGELADAIAEELRGRLEGPVALLGHSMGATVAYEVARRLEEAGEPPLALFASGRRAPDSLRDERVHLATDAQVMAHVARLSGTGAGVLDDPEIVRMVLPVIRGDYRAAETYRHRPGPPLSCPLYALTGDDDPQVSPAEADEWARFTTGPFEKAVFDGGHFYFTTGPDKPMAYLGERLTALAAETL
ncbi:thioesterase II family protein [Streptomyces sp. NPDC056503]|uniref:thioesterase II family protein n=1 Tax=Streptomyces sp. NPDC056503 TaxID=3345842 RepID=UPI0036A7CAE9